MSFTAEDGVPRPRLPLTDCHGRGQGLVPEETPRWRVWNAAVGPGGAGSEQKELPGRRCAGQPGKRIKTEFKNNPLNRRQ